MRSTAHSWALSFSLLLEDSISLEGAEPLFWSQWPPHKRDKQKQEAKLGVADADFIRQDLSEPKDVNTRVH